MFREVKQTFVHLLLVVLPGVIFISVYLLGDEPSVNHEVLARLSGPLAGDDPLVLEMLKTHFLDPPSTLPYNLTSHSWYAQGKNAFTWPWIYFHLQKLFAGQRGGFFLEAGALDGEYTSNTLWLEQELSWTGLLIEADKANYIALRHKHRRSWSSETCVSSEVYPKQVIFVSHFSKQNVHISMSPWSYRSHSHELRGDVSQDKHDILDDMSYSRVQCFPLLSYLKALNVSTVDLLSLDVQGTEVAIISNFLNSNTTISVRVIVAENEYNKFDASFLSLLSEKGYVILAAAVDYIFVKRDDPILDRPEVKKFFFKDYSMLKLETF